MFERKGRRSVPEELPAHAKLARDSNAVPCSKLHAR